MLLIISVLVGIAAAFGWLSSRVLKLPTTIGTMLLTAITSVALVLVDPIWPAPHHWALGIIGQIDFERLILHGMLSLLLFAGAFLLDLNGLRRQSTPRVALLAVIATIFSILAVAGMTYYAVRLFGYHSSLLECLLFGALISPTDPIAVLEMLRRVHAPKNLEAQLAGESLFNDGIGAVIFISLLAATRGAMPTTPHIILQIFFAAGGGLLIGAVLAAPVALLMRTVNSAAIEILLSLALALGGYVLAEHIGISAPLEAVAAGLVLRSLIERHPKHAVAHHDLNHFWTNTRRNSELDPLRPARVRLPRRRLSPPGGLRRRLRNPHRQPRPRRIHRRRAPPAQTPPHQLLKFLAVLSWGGLRGGLPIALSLSIPPSYGEGWIVTSTYVIVVFSILVQGGTMDLFLQRLQNTKGLQLP